MNESTTKKIPKLNLFQVFSFLILIACLLGTIYVFRARYRYTLTSDEASELVLGKLLSEEGGILSKNWYYSTEIRVLNVNIPYAFFFRITDSWHRVRVLSTVSLYLLILGLYYGMSRVYRFPRWFALTAAPLFIPFSEVWYYILTIAVHYLPFIATTFLIMILSEFSLRLSGWKQKALLAFTFVFSVLTGLGGPKQLLVTCFPLMAAAAAAFLDKKKKPETGKWLIYAADVFLGSVIGYLGNSLVLSKIYSFWTWNDVKFTGFSVSRIGDVLTGFLASFGYTTGDLASFALVKNFAAILWLFLTVLAVRYAIKYREEVSGGYVRLAIFMIAAAVIFLAFYVFTDAYHHERYNIPFILLSYPLIALFLEQGSWKRIPASAALTALVFLTAVCGIRYCASMWSFDRTEELRKIADFLVDEGYQNGYSTYWRSNVVTEFSNGKLDIWSITGYDWDYTFLEVDDIDQTYHWLQKTSHDTTHPEGKLFILFTMPEYVNNSWKDNFTDDLVIYQSDDYVILGFRDYDSMILQLYTGYDYAFGDNEGLDNGADIDGIRYLRPDGLSVTPAKHYWPGSYEITLHGSALGSAELSLTAGLGEREIEITELEANEDTLRYSFDLPEKTHDVQIVIRRVPGRDDPYVTIESLTVRRKDR